MAALMRKEFYLIGKQIWSLIAVALLLSFVPRLESFGSSYLMVLAITLPLTTMTYDERCHWDTYLAMTPCRPEKIVFSKYLFAAGLTAAAMGIGMLISFIQAASARPILIERNYPAYGLPLWRGKGAADHDGGDARHIRCDCWRSKADWRRRYVRLDRRGAACPAVDCRHCCVCRRQYCVLLPVRPLLPETAGRGVRLKRRGDRWDHFVN